MNAVFTPCSASHSPRVAAMNSLPLSERSTSGLPCRANNCSSCVITSRAPIERAGRVAVSSRQTRATRSGNGRWPTSIPGLRRLLRAKPRRRQQRQHRKQKTARSGTMRSCDRPARSEAPNSRTARTWPSSAYVDVEPAADWSTLDCAMPPSLSITRLEPPHGLVSPCRSGSSDRAPHGTGAQFSLPWSTQRAERST